MNHQQQPETKSIVSNLFAIKLENDVTQKLLPVNWFYQIRERRHPETIASKLFL